MKEVKVKNVQQLGSYFRRYWMLYAMLIPGLTYIIIFKYMPMYGVTIAFKDYDGIGSIMEAPWVGWDNFRRLFGTRAFKRALENNIIISLLKIAFGFPSPIILALLIDATRSKRLRKVAQTTALLPSFISWVVMYGLIYAILSPSVGTIQGVAEFFGYQGRIPDYLASKEHIRTVVILTYLWDAAGPATIVYLSAIAGVDQELYDAAAIDGAGFWRQMWHVTVAGIRTTIITLFIIRVGGIMSAGFDQIFALSNDAVISKIDIIDTYVYRIGMTQRNFSVATAAGLFKSSIGLVLVLITNKISRKVDPESGLF